MVRRNLRRDLILKKPYKRILKAEKPLEKQSTEELQKTMLGILRKFTAVGFQRWHGSPSSRLNAAAISQLKQFEDFLKANGRRDLLVVLNDEKKRRGIP